jgi:hypothetical protein
MKHNDQGLVRKFSSDKFGEHSHLSRAESRNCHVQKFVEKVRKRNPNSNEAEATEKGSFWGQL